MQSASAEICRAADAMRSAVFFGVCLAIGNRSRESTMSEEAQREPMTQSGGTATGEFFAQMVRDVGETVRREVEHLRADVGERAAGGAKGARLLAGAGAAGTVGVAAVGSLPLMALRRVMPAWMIALGVAGGAAGVAVVLTRRGLAELGSAAPLDAARIKEAARQAVRTLA